MGIKVLILEIDGAASDTELSLRTGRPGNGIIVRHHVAIVKFKKVGIVILISFSTAVQLCSVIVYSFYRDDTYLLSSPSPKKALRPTDKNWVSFEKLR